MSAQAAADSRPLLVFSHANGFPAAVYRKLFRALDPQFRVRAVEKFGHDVRYPVRDDWSALAQQLVDFLQQQCHGEPAVLVGHSLGGYLSLMAAHAHPELARQVILLDSPVVAGWRARLLWLSKRTGLGERFSPAAAAKHRRMQWPDTDAVRAHFAGKPAFMQWDTQMLQDYATLGTVPIPQGRTLAFEREIEYRIYKTLPHHLGRLARRPFAVPVSLIAGRQSREIRLAGLHASKRLTQGRLYWIDGTHLFPFESPQHTAELIGQAFVAAQTPCLPGGAPCSL
ncbi:alpha/beta hydrolase [Thiomonas sp.]|uniref:alpha/beta fold hydrolase n=1 Tax=Thiomonas sp. TaxID=2047785 RepID=UPI00260C7035|nr:alpha/beta hydrolase [Thiomonas sp.]